MWHGCENTSCAFSIHPIFSPPPSEELEPASDELDCSDELLDDSSDDELEEFDGCSSLEEELEELTEDCSLEEEDDDSEDAGGSELDESEALESLELELSRDDVLLLELLCGSTAGPVRVATYPSGRLR